jgi:hypothetical protein
MHEAAAVSEKTHAEIPYGILEYTAVFKKPILEAWTIPANIIIGVLEALDPFGFKMDGVELKTHTEKIAEYEVLFRRNPAGVTLRVGMSRLVLVAENLDWTEAGQLVEAARAGIAAVIQRTKAEIETQHVSLGLHIQLKDKPRQEVTAPLLAPAAFQLLDGELKFPGVILQREKSSIVVDASLAFANGLFVRLNREHAADVPLERMAELLQADEVRLFETLGLEGVL